MEAEEKYSLAMGTEVVCRILDIDPDVMIARAGLAELAHGRTDFRVSAQQYFNAWNTAAEMAGRPDYVTHLGVNLTRGSIIPVFFALACAPDLETGLMRLSAYKALLGPSIMRVYRRGGVLQIDYDSADPRLELPASLAALHLTVSVEQARAATAHHLCPLAATLKSPEEERRQIAGHLGIMPDYSDIASLTFSERDARRPLISENPRLWVDFEEDLKLQLAAHNNQLSMAGRVRACLVDLMTSGRANAEDVCHALSLSRSTLQRRLRAEGITFQQVLDKTRRELAERYLAKSTLRTDEIATMLGYRDPNSFSRSFRRLTGTPPGDFRAGAD
ncbi:MAG: helix-turn-helix domain-containing protein [Pseudomonadota bacterium]